MHCAYCGKDRDLAETGWTDGIKEPRPCMPCLIKLMEGEELPVRDFDYLTQLLEDQESIESIRASYPVAEKGAS